MSLGDAILKLEVLAKQHGPTGSEGLDTALDSGSGSLSLSAKDKIKKKTLEKIGQIAKAKVDIKLTPPQKEARRKQQWESKIKGPVGVHEESGWKQGQSLMGLKYQSGKRAIQATPGSYPEHQQQVGGKSGPQYGAKMIGAAKQIARQKIAEQRAIKQPKLPKSESGLDKAIEKMRDAAKSFSKMDKTTHDEAKEMLGEKSQKKIAHKTTLRETPEGHAVKYHDTDVITIHPDNKWTLNAGGFGTVTTKRRINEHLPVGVKVSQKEDIWHVHGHEGKVPFKDNMTIDRTGKPIGKIKQAA